MKIDATAQFWRTKGLSVRASYCLAKADIANEQELIDKFTTLDSLIALRNCGRKTAEEIWEFLTNLKFVPNYDQETEITSFNSSNKYSPKAQSVFIPLLNIKVSAQTWEALQKIPVNNILWSVRTQNILLVQGFKTLAEIAELSARQWLKFKNFRRKSLIEIQETINEIIENPDMLNPGDEHSGLDPNHSVKSQWFFISLLNIKVSTHTWEALQKTPVNSIQWSVRTRNVIKQQGLQQLADLCQFSSEEWLSFRNFGSTSLTELQVRLTKTVKKLRTKPDIFVPNDEHSDPRTDQSVKAQWVFIFLLNRKVSAQTWKALQKTSVNSIQWSVRTKNVIKQQGLQQLADLCQFSSEEWLSFRNFGSTSLTELLERLTEIVEQISHKCDMVEPPDESSNPSPDPPVEALPVFLPLLDIEVPAQIWEALQNMPSHQFTWRVRTRNVIIQKNIKTLAEIADISPREWLFFRNFGRKSLTEIQETVNNVIANPDVLDPKVKHSEVSQIQTLAELGHIAFQRLEIRQKEVIKHYYGYEEERKNLQRTGEILGLSRERIRQIKKAANTKINQGEENHLITTAIFSLLNELICDILSNNGGWCSVEKLQEIIRQWLGWENSEQWIINWFNEAFGEAWICLGADDYKIVDGVCHLKSGEPFQDFLTQLASRLQHYGYRPLALEKCQNLIKKMDGEVCNYESSSIAFDSGRLLNVISSYPSLKVYQYGKTFIGLKAWTWFNPEKPMTFAGQAALIEWYLRMTNAPATAKAIANGIESRLGNFRLTPFDVADICEKHPYRFQVDDNGAFGLLFWEESSKYRQDLTELLSDEPVSIEQIVEVLSAQESADTMLIVAALNFLDSFVETVPFEWVLKPQTDTIETEDDFDYTKLTFEDLIPKL